MMKKPLITLNTLNIFAKGPILALLTCNFIENGKTVFYQLLGVAVIG